MVHTLNEQQQQMVEKNHNLIYSFAYKRNLSIEEYYDILAIALCKAAATFDETRGIKFSVLAYRCMENSVKMHWRTITCKSAIPDAMMLSYDSVVTENDSGEGGLTLLDMLSDMQSENDVDIHNLVCEEFMNGLATQEKTALQLRLSGYKQIEIARVMKLSQAYISRILSKVKDKWLVYCH